MDLITNALDEKNWEAGVELSDTTRGGQTSINPTTFDGAIAFIPQNAINRAFQLEDKIRVGTENTRNEVFRKLPVAAPQLASLAADAKSATDSEHRMTLLQGLKLYPKAIGWSVVLSTAIIMEGYDTNLIASFFAFPAFSRRYGELTPEDGYQVTSSWQAGLTNGAVVGEILGLLFNGIIAERYGHRVTMMVALTAVCCFVFLSFFAVDVKMLEVGEVLCGIPWGVFQTLTTTYAAEVMPVALRAYLTAYVNLCWVMGQLICSGILQALVDNESELAYKVPFAVQWAWAVPILIGVTLAPESPWWLVRHGEIDKAKTSLLRLTSKVDVNFDVDKTIAMMRHTDELEKKMDEGRSYQDCFRGVNMRRTEIACMVWLVQVLCGGAVMGYSTYFYLQAGLPTHKAFDMALGQYGLGFVGTCFSWFLMKHFGRRTLYLWGMGIMCLTLLVASILATAVDDSKGAWVIASMILVFTFVYDCTIGPVCYALVAEIPSTRLRIKTVVLARTFYNVGLVISNVLMANMLDPTSWNWRGKAAYFWTGTCFLCFVWTYFRLPEPKGLTFAELDILFARKASVRKFRQLQVSLAESGYFSIVSSTNLNDWHGEDAVDSAGTKKKARTVDDLTYHTEFAVDHNV